MLPHPTTTTTTTATKKKKKKKKLLSADTDCVLCVCVSVLCRPKTFAINKSVMFCTNHYKQLFATKGNYDEGFGHDQHKKRWKSEPNLADDAQSNSTDTTQH